jgi:hypothetical protein
VAQRNREQYPNGMTGYEQYYIDLEGFWRDLYYPTEAQKSDMNKLKAKKAAAQDQLAITENAAVQESL